MPNSWKSFTDQMTPQDIEFWSNALLVVIAADIIIALSIVGLYIWVVVSFRPDGRI